MSATSRPHAPALPPHPDGPVPRLVVGSAPVHPDTGTVAGSFVEMDGHPAYRIDHVDGMAPFFVTVVSDADHWLFASSTGGLTAGRCSPDHALFPYETVDRIHDAQDRTGSKTLLLVSRSGEGDGAPQAALWEPFSDRRENDENWREEAEKFVPNWND